MENSWNPWKMIYNWWVEKSLFSEMVHPHSSRMRLPSFRGMVRCVSYCPTPLAFSAPQKWSQIYVNWLVVWLPFFIFPYIGFLSSSQLTKSYFSEGWPNHQPVNLLWSLRWVLGGWNCCGCCCWYSYEGFFFYLYIASSENSWRRDMAGISIGIRHY